MYLSWYILGPAIALVVCGVALIAYLERAYRCMRYCYIEMSDFASGKFDQIAEQVFETFEARQVPDVVTEAKADWKAKLTYHSGLMKRASVPPVTEADWRYALEDR